MSSRPFARTGGISFSGQLFALQTIDSVGGLTCIKLSGNAGAAGVARGRMPTAHDASRQVVVSVILNGRFFRYFCQGRAQIVPIGLDDPVYDAVQDPA